MPNAHNGKQLDSIVYAVSLIDPQLLGGGPSISLHCWSPKMYTLMG